MGRVGSDEVVAATHRRRRCPALTVGAPRSKPQCLTTPAQRLAAHRAALRGRVLRGVSPARGARQRGDRGEGRYKGRGGGGRLP